MWTHPKRPRNLLFVHSLAVSHKNLKRTRQLIASRLQKHLKPFESEQRQYLKVWNSAVFRFNFSSFLYFLCLCSVCSNSCIIQHKPWEIITNTNNFVYFLALMLSINIMSQFNFWKCDQRPKHVHASASYTQREEDYWFQKLPNADNMWHGRAWWHRRFDEARDVNNWRFTDDVILTKHICRKLLQQEV